MLMTPQVHSLNFSPLLCAPRARPLWTATEQGGPLVKLVSLPGHRADCSLVAGFLLGLQMGGTADVREGDGQDLVTDSWGPLLLHWLLIPRPPPLALVTDSRAPFSCTGY